eukprot:scaffold4964_cov123-Chaetoceros_neogracile.AAC.1
MGFGCLVYCGGGARVKAACEMPRPCVRNVEQAQGKPRNSYYTRSKPKGEEFYFFESVRSNYHSPFR